MSYTNLSISQVPTLGGPKCTWDDNIQEEIEGTGSE
jgi:hypothetical protein